MPKGKKGFSSGAGHHRYRHVALGGQLAAATGDAASAGADGDFVAASPPSPVLGAFVFRNLARPVALSNTSSALGGGRAPVQDTLCAVAAGRLPTAAGQPTPGGGGAKSTGKASVSSFMVSTLSICVPRMLSRALVIRFTVQEIDTICPLVCTDAQRWWW